MIGAPITTWLLLPPLLMGCARQGFDAPFSGSRDGAADLRALSEMSTTDQAPHAVDGPTLLTDGQFDLNQADLGSLTTFDCASSAVDSHTALLLDFNHVTGQIVPDLVGANSGLINGVGTSVTPGKPGCAQALHLPKGDTQGGYVRVAHSPSWNLASGAIDLWVRFDPTPQGETPLRGIVSRDEHGTSAASDGHIGIFRVCDDSIAVRLQRGAQDYFQCSPPVPDQTWIHVGVNFGPTTGLELFVNGIRANRTDIVPWATTPKSGACNLDMFCGTSTNAGIEGNTLPWILGASAARVNEGTSSPLYFFMGGEIDHFRISDAPRDFAAGP